ncbi:MAG: hypothetical protein JRC99_00030 [Deltaproteobacteria bacterium]|nr:hypothetical protein [Deltaproteobacteria bacterium]
MRCNLVHQDAIKRKRCPSGQSALIDAIRTRAGLSITDRGDEATDVFTMPILTQNRTGWNNSLALSHGELSEPEVFTKNGTVSINLSLGDFSPSGNEVNPYKTDLAMKVNAKIELEIDLIRSAISPGRLFGADSKVIYQSGSPLTISGDNLLTRKPVVGNISVAYTVSGQLQVATSSPREDAQAGNYELSLWIVSTCGQVSNFEIKVPECFQRAWWEENGYPGDVESTEPPNYSKKKDVNYSWIECGLHEAADQQTTNAFADVPGNGPVYYPGIKLEKQERRSTQCYSKHWNGDD